MHANDEVRVDDCPNFDWCFVKECSAVNPGEGEPGAREFGGLSSFDEGVGNDGDFKVVDGVSFGFCDGGVGIGFLFIRLG